jgi:uncharacterized protein
VKAIFSYKTQSINASIKDVDGKKGIVTGYFAKFDNVDADGDIIRKGAFTKSIIETGPASTQPRIKHLLNHNTNQPLGALVTLSEDAYGLNYESQIGSHALGQDFIKMVESNLITEHSIGFQVMKRNQLQEYSEYAKNPDMGMYELTDLKLWEGSSLTAWGANQQTPITGLKSEKKEDVLQNLVNRQKNLEKFCRNSTATDETIELLLIECKQLTQLIIENTKQVKINCPHCKKDTPDIESGMGYIKCINCGETFNSKTTSQPGIKNVEVLEALKSFTNSLKK